MATLLVASKIVKNLTLRNRLLKWENGASVSACLVNTDRMAYLQKAHPCIRLNKPGNTEAGFLQTNPLIKDSNRPSSYHPQA